MKELFGDICQNGLKLQKITYSFTEYYNDSTGYILPWNFSGSKLLK